MSTHSPGPWRVGGVADGALGVVDAHGAGVAGVWTEDGMGRPVPTFEADARLIAAAPELLEWVRSYLSGWTIDVDTWEAENSAAWALIARIDGKEPTP